MAGGRAGLHDPLRGGMQMQHYIHRHEPPVLDLEIPVSLTRALPLVYLKPCRWAKDSPETGNTLQKHARTLIHADIFSKSRH